ncbi:MAG: hypothetical protein M3Y87_22685 [Myxococcota bacterium]|nr:hypothetical protein [Myxococcota bacterium]
MTVQRAFAWWVMISVLATTGCAVSNTLDDAGTDPIDATTARDDARTPELDAGDLPDARADDDAGPPDAGPPETCETPGVMETVPCGMCGTTARFCTAERTWAYGACEGEGGECVPGSIDDVACGNCGTQAARCNASCTWETTGACTGEGPCAPGERTRGGEGCPAGQTRELLCSDACVLEPATACSADSCPTPGVIDATSCGMCGTQERFCNASRVWEYGACMGEGVCMPGTTSTTACGMCGTQATRCTDACTYVASGTCGGEGVCTPGARQRTSAGCPAGQTRVLECGATCGFSTVVEPCSATRPVDVTLLLDTTGSNQGSLTSDLPTITSRCITPLLALSDVLVGVSYAGEYPLSPYGSTGDRPFEGGIEPSSSSTAISAELAAWTRFSGNDAQDAAVEALSVLSGGPVAASSLALACSAGRVAGGCWRTGAQRVVVVHTDSPIHNGPDPASTGLLAPYTGISPAPATWPEVRTRMMADGTVLIWIDSDSLSPAPAQFDEMLTDLGQPLTDRHVTETTTEVGVACDAIVARVRALAGL